MAELQNNLPPGWECQVDKKTGKLYFINHYTKTTTWDDPRRRHHHNLAHRTPTMPTEHIAMQDLGNLSKSSPRGSRVQDSSLANVANAEEAVTKISAMFPTVSDTHIRVLLKKYMKSIFPKAEETVILDILSNNDNNIQKASEILKEMGFEKRDSAASLRQQHAAKLQLSKPMEEPQPQAAAAPKIKSLADKKKIKAKLQAKYKDIPEQVIVIALESVEFDEDRANQILQFMVQEEQAKVVASEVQQSNENEITEISDVTRPVATVPLSQSRQSLKTVLKTEKSDYSLKDGGVFSRVIEEPESMTGAAFKSQYLTSTSGANRSLVKGANQDLLLEDYVKWQGPQPAIHQGPQKGLAKGPNAALLSPRTYQPLGPNAELRKGPKFGLAKGSIFSQLKGVVVGESRGK